MQDFYQRLDVDHTASPDDIKKAYRKMAMKYHPDHNKDDPTAEDKFKDIAEAYEVLSNEESKSLYDRVGHSAWKSGASQGGNGFNRAYHNQPFSENFEFDIGDMEEVFDSIFGRRTGWGFKQNKSPFDDIFKSAYSRRHHTRHANINKSINIQYSITLEEAFTGKETTLKYRLPNGDERNVSFSIPPGVTEGMRISIRGKGEDTHKGHPPGDLYINPVIMDHPIFTRDNSDLVMEMNIDVFDAMSGIKKTIDTFDGKSVKLDIPAGSQHGHIFRLSGQGMPIYGNKRRGDMYVHLFIRIPSVDEMSSDEKTKLKKLHDNINGGKFLNIKL